MRRQEKVDLPVSVIILEEMSSHKKMWDMLILNSCRDPYKIAFMDPPT